LRVDNFEYSNALRKAFLQSIEVLGDSGSGALIRSLARYDIDIDSYNLSIDDLRLGLTEIIGQGSADLVMQLVFSKLDRMLNAQTSERRI
jgi:hypothetical protein